MLFDLWYDFWTEKFPYWLAFIIFSAIMGSVFVYRGRKIKGEIKTQKYVYYGYAAFIYAYIITRIVFLFSDLELMRNGPYYDSYVLAGYISTISALLILIYTIEKQMIQKTRQIFTIISGIVLAAIIVLFILSFAYENIVLIGRILAYIFSGISIALIGYLYIYISIHTGGTLRRNAIFSLIGLIIITVGILLDSQYLAQAGIVPIQLPPIIAMVGMLIFVMGQKPL